MNYRFISWAIGISVSSICWGAAHQSNNQLGLVQPYNIKRNLQDPQELQQYIEQLSQRIDNVPPEKTTSSWWPIVGLSAATATAWQLCNRWLSSGSVWPTKSSVILHPPEKYTEYVVQQWDRVSPVLMAEGPKILTSSVFLVLACGYVNWRTQKQIRTLQTKTEQTNKEMLQVLRATQNFLKGPVERKLKKALKQTQDLVDIVEDTRSLTVKMGNQNAQENRSTRTMLKTMVEQLKTDVIDMRETTLQERRERAEQSYTKLREHLDFLRAEERGLYKPLNTSKSKRDEISERLDLLGKDLEAWKNGEFKDKDDKNNSKADQLLSGLEKLLTSVISWDMLGEEEDGGDAVVVGGLNYSDE